MEFKITKALLALCMCGMLFSCGGEDLDDTGEPVFKSSNLTADISSADLLGKWELIGMEGDREVDFNGDGIGSIDMLSETSCFNIMYYEFFDNGVVETGQARLWFDSSGNFTCLSGEYAATYSISQDILRVDFNLNGSPMTEEKQIALTSDATGDYLHVTLSDLEAAAYVNDPGTTNASHLSLIKMVYKKEL
ncbi:MULTISPECIES: lipocalin family protein [Antarcticibacterium]|nr:MULTISPECIES: lipocalin family protein [Antarcticibacterium]